MIFAKKIEQIYRNRLFVRYDDRGVARYFSASDFSGLVCEPFSFKSSAGNRLQGYFYHYASPIANRLVVFDHGMGGGHRAYMKEINELAAHGYLVFSYDHTGCMESEGESANGFAQSLADLNDCLNALKAAPICSDRGISVVGHSWGGFACLNIAAFHPDVQCIVAISGFASVERMLRQSFGGVLAPFRSHIYRVEAETNPAFAACRAEESLKKTNAKVLILHSEDDRTVRADIHFEFLKRALKGQENISFLSVSGKGHNPNYTIDAVQYLGDYLAALNEKQKRGELSDEAQKRIFVASYDWDRMTAQDADVWRQIFATLDAV